MSTDSTKTRNETAEQKSARLAEVSSASDIAAANASIGGGLALRDAVRITVNSDGYCELSYSSTVCGDDDFVGVYENASLPQADNTGGNTGWQWCTRVSSFPYTTSVKGQKGLVAIYWSKDYRTGDYVRVCYTNPLPAADAGSTAYGTTS